MKKFNTLYVISTYLLVLLLFSQTFVQTAFANYPKSKLYETSITKPIEDRIDAIPISQQEVLDAATKNFLKGLSGTRFEVAMSVIQTVRKAGGKVVAVGSWVSGTNYLDPILGGTSDHDLRLVFEGSEPLAKAKYNQIRREIIRQINERFGADAPKILRSINLYPPEVFLEGIDDVDDALRKLMQEGINPNLGDAVTEGVWGKGGKAFRDAYEAKAGRMIWKEGNTIRSGFADLLPAFGERSGIYTIQGAGNTAKQFADKVDDALKAGDAKSVQKSLMRLRDTLKKGRDLSALNKTSYLDDLLNKLDDCCKNDLKKLSTEINKPAFRESLRNGLQRAKFEAELLLQFASETNPQNLQIIREMLQTGTGKWSRVKDAFLKYGGKVAEVGGKVRWDLAFKGFFAILTVYQVYDYYKKITEADLEGILQNALIDATFLVSPAFIIGFVPLILKAIMDDAVDYGYALVTAAQDCQDLLAGIYEVKGREQLEPNQRLERSVDQLATQYTDERKILAIVAVHARNAAMRNGKEDPKAEKFLYDRCSTEIINRWRWRRIDIISEAIEILKNIERDFDSLQMIGSVDPQEVWVLNELKATVDTNIKLIGNTSPIQQKLIQFANKIKSLGGEENIVGVDIRHIYQWIPGTEEVDLTSPNEPIFNSQKASNKFDFQYPGQIPLKFEYGLEIKVQTTADDVFSVVKNGYLEKKLYKSVSFEVNVIAPQGNVEIIAPAQSAAGKPVNLTAKLDESLKKLKDYRLIWQDLSGSALPKAGNSYSITSEDGGLKNVRLEVWAKINGVETKIAQTEKTISIDEKTAETKPSLSPSPSATPDVPIDTSPKALMFGGTATNIWDGTNDEKGFTLKRKTSIATGMGGCEWKSSVSASVWGKINPSFTATTPAQIEKKVAEFKAESKRWGRKIKREGPIVIGDFKGKFIESEVRFRSGWASPDAGYKGDEVNAYGQGWLINENRKPIEIGYSVTGAGCYNNSDRAYLERQAGTAQSEAFAIIKGLTLTGGGFSKTDYNGPKLDGSDMPTIEIVTNPNRKKLKKGEIVEVQAIVKNAEADDEPINFEWTGDHGGKGANVQFIAEKTGKQTLSVVANGAKYRIGSASVEFEIADLKAEIKQITPVTKVAVGTPVSFSAQLLSEGKPASGNYIYRFQPSPEVEFDVNESAKKQTTAKFNKPGREKVWVVILEQKGDSLETVAESEQIEVEVVEPELKITFDQEKALVGKAVKAKVEVAPADLKNIDFRWEISSNARKTLESNDSKEITFIPQDGKPVTVKVSARVPVSGENLGDQTATITAQSFDVKVDVLGTLGPKPQIWKEGVGLVNVDKGIAVFQNVGLKAVVTPIAENLRYKWTLNEDSHFVGSSNSAEIRVNRSQTGTCEASVVVTDKDGIELGRGTASFNVSISQETLDTASKSADSAKKLADAKTISRKGDIDEAIKLADESATLNPKNTEAKTLANKLKRDKQTINTQIEKTKQLISQSKFPEAQKELFVAKNINGYYKLTVELEKELGDKWRKYEAGVQAELGNIRVSNEKKDFKNTLILADKLRLEYQLTPYYQKELAISEQWAKKQEAEKERQRGILANGETKFKQGDYAGAIKDFDVLYPNFNNYWNVNIDIEPKKYGDLKAEAIKRQKRITQLVPSIKRTIEFNAKNEVLLNQSLKDVEELISYQPNNAEFKNYRSTINDLLRNKANEAKIDPIMERGDNAFKAKKYKDAIREYTRVISIDPNNVEAYRRRAMANREQGYEKDALSDFNKVIELDPDNYQAFLGRGILHKEMKKSREAMNDLTRGIGLNPKYASGYFQRGLLRIDEEDYKGAVDDFNAVIRLEPKNSSAYINRGLAKSKLGDLNGAERDYNQAIIVNPKNSLAYNNRGALKEKRGDLKGAKADFEKAVQVDPDNKLANNNLQKVENKISGNQTATTKPPTNTKPPTTIKPPVSTERMRISVTYMNASRQDIHIFATGEKFSANNKLSPGGRRVVSGEGPKFSRITVYAGSNGKVIHQISFNVTSNGNYTVTFGRNNKLTLGQQASGNTNTTPSTSKRLSGTFINASRRTVHIYATGERFSSANRLAPGAKRVSSKTVSGSTDVTVYATDTNGKIIYQYTYKGVPPGTYTLTFGSNNRFSIKFQ